MWIDAHEFLDSIQQLRETCHDMRQPVASVFALAVPDLPAAARERLKQIVSQAKWLSGMIDGVPRLGQIAYASSKTAGVGVTPRLPSTAG